MSPFDCPFCGRSFKYLDVYRHHKLTCEYLSNENKKKSRKETNAPTAGVSAASELARECDLFEVDMPSMQEMFKYCQHLAVQCDKLKRDVEVLKQAEVRVSRKRKIDRIRDKSANPDPVMPFEEWIRKENICIDDEMMAEVWRDSLLSGMKRFVKQESDKHGRNLPIRCFSTDATPVVFYIYTLPPPPLTSSAAHEEPRGPHWRVMSSEEWKRWIEKLEHRFLQEYLELSSVESSHRMQVILRGGGGGGGGGGDNGDHAMKIITKNLSPHEVEKEKEKEIMFMLKISDCQETVSKRRMKDLRKWIVPFLFHAM